MSQVPSCQCLLSASCHQLSVPHVQRRTSVRFSVAGLRGWNSLPEDLQNPAVDSEHFNGNFYLLTYLSRVHTCHKMAPLNGTILWRHKIARLA